MNCTIPTHCGRLDVVAAITHYTRFAVEVIAPIVIGAMIYVLFRTTNLLVFRWIEAIGLLQFTLQLRQLCSGVALPDWLLYSLPDGLWVFAFTRWIILIWDRAPPLAWLVIGAALGVGGEFGQVIGIVPGTYQHLDMVFYISGFFAACLQTEIRHESPLPFRVRFIGHGYFRFWKR